MDVIHVYTSCFQVPPGVENDFHRASTRNLELVHLFSVGQIQTVTKFIQLFPGTGFDERVKRIDKVQFYIHCRLSGVSQDEFRPLVRKFELQFRFVPILRVNLHDGQKEFLAGFPDFISQSVPAFFFQNRQKLNKEGLGNTIHGQIRPVKPGVQFKHILFSGFPLKTMHQKCVRTPTRKDDLIRFPLQFPGQSCTLGRWRGKIKHPGVPHDLWQGQNEILLYLKGFPVGQPIPGSLQAIMQGGKCVVDHVFDILETHIEQFIQNPLRDFPQHIHHEHEPAFQHQGVSMEILGL